MSEELFLPAEDAKLLNIDPSKLYNRLYIKTDEIIIECGKLQIKIPSFWNLEDIDELVFQIGDKTYKFCKEKKK